MINLFLRLENIGCMLLKRGDSLYKLSKTYEVSIDNIKKWNNISGSKIIIGQKIKLILKNE